MYTLVNIFFACISIRSISVISILKNTNFLTILNGMCTYTKKENRRIYIQNKYFMRIYMQILILQEYSYKF